ncbi:amino acid adenylation domain-containing protein [Nocardia sp. NPDC059240]|uniref:non-ribosomal peptide synthetase n=1 Tax=Nocardia sp. NPDC059240 TaxID=3346786 RepID=UPI0036985B5D
MAGDSENSAGEIRPGRKRPVRTRNPRLHTLPELLLTAVESDPDAVALVLADESDTIATCRYAELDERSTRLARLLIARGIGPEDLIAVGIPRSIESVLAVWAITKAGAGFVPVDPKYPADRVAHMVTDSGAALGLTVGAARAGLPDTVEWLAVDTPEVGARLSGYPAELITNADRVRPLRGHHPAYVIYTSGSTGLPKGVVVSQAAVSTYCSVQRERLDATPDSRVLHVISPSFDVSVGELLLAIGAAGTLVIAAPGVFGGPELAALLRRERVTHMMITPSALASVDPSGLDGLRVVVAAGEACPPELVRRWAIPIGTGRTRRFVNGYGPTEATILATTADLTPDLPVTIGGTLRTVSGYVLDERLEPSFAGVPGELYLAGEQLARGYHRRPGLTAQRFVANPLGPSGSRVYRTGDLVRQTPGGELEYLGRNDFQVKIRGFRIELGEIDVVLASHPSVDFAVTIGHELADGATILASYVHGPAIVDPDELTALARRGLPAHMVPAVVTVLDRIPLTPVGKLDRRALPAPRLGAAAFRAPAGRIELLVAEVFAELLGAVDPIGADDSFFELGGNSLIATRAAARLGALISARVPGRLLFTAPTVATLAAELAGLEGVGGRAALVPQPRPERIPLSPAQRRMWFLNQFDTGSAAENIPFALRVTGALDVAALRAAFGDVIERHEALRTVYPEVGGAGSQVIVPAAQVIPELTVQPVHEEELAGWLAGVALTGFDVSARVPLRVELARLGADEHVVAIVLHHIAADGFSTGPFARDLLTAYLARREGGVPDWQPLPVQYADYTLWQRALLGRESRRGSLAAVQIAYWRAALADIPDRIELPADRPRPTVASGRGATFAFEIGAELVAGIEGLARSGGASPFMVLHSALAALLARLSGTDDIVIGTPVAGRGEAALDDLVGMFVNTLVLRTRVDAGAGFAELLRAAKEVDLAAFSQAELPFERLVEVLDPVRTQAHHPLFQVALFFQNLDAPQVELPGLSITSIESDSAVAKFDLQLSILPREQGGMGAVFTYATDLFDESTVAGFADRLVRILSAGLADTALAIGDIELLDPRERARMVLDWNDTRHTVADESLLGGFRRAVVAHPDAMAVHFEGVELTYREFDERVNRLARLLIDRGVGPESLVGLAVRRSLDLVIGMYAVLTAGGAYVPLDPDHPAERIAHILDTARPVCVLTTARDDFELPDAPGLALRIDELELSGYSDAPVTDADRRAPLRSSNAAYVIFTSGSTGRPKGVAVSHAGVHNQISWMLAEYPMGPGDVYLQKTATTFDVSLWGYFMPLRTGAKLVVATHDGHRDPVYMAETIARQGVTVTDFVPSMLTVFAAHAAPGRLGSLRDVFVIGEALPPETVAAFAEVSSARVHNLYGPTEAAVSVTYWQARGDERASVPIGVPQWNTRVYVLDSRLRPVPVGVAGELYLAGGQLARGYVRRPDLTSDRFVANPFGTGERMYRTGDLVVWRDAGSDRPARLDYLGRTDFQVKFRGQRIELGEIETALLACSGVSAAAASVMPSELGDQLVAHVVAMPGRVIVESELLTALADVLPRYMIPSAVVVLDEFPLNASGKLDRKALPAPTFAGREFRAPATPVEEIVAGVFAEVLGVGRVGADDDFFALGGNSLIATAVVARLGAALGDRVPVRTLFESPTVTALAAAVESRVRHGRTVELGGIERPERLLLSPAQQRMWFLNRFDDLGDGTVSAGSAAYNLPFALRLSGGLEVRALRAALDDVVSRHEVLRTVYPQTPDGPAQLVRVAGDDSLPRLAVVRVVEAEIAGAVYELAATPFDVTREVPIRVRLFEVTDPAPEPRYVLAVVAHHIAADASSMAPLVRDIMTAYTARVAGAEPPWSPLRVQYADYALWQREVLGDEADPESIAAQQLAYWRRELAGLPDLLELPTDRPRPAVASALGSRVWVRIDPEIHAGVVRIAQEHQATVFMVVHAAFAALLARLSGTDDIAIGTPVAGRGERELDDLIGMFVNTVVFRTRVDGGEPFSGLLARQRETDLQAFSHSDIPFERLVEVLEPPRTTAHHPLFQVGLSFQNMTRAALELPGLTISPVDSDLAVSQFDLHLIVSDGYDEHGAPAGIGGYLTYATELFDAATVTGFVDRLNRLLAAIVENPAVRVGEIDLLSSAERTEILDARNATAHQVDSSATLASMLDATVAATPTAIALIGPDGETLTYAELGTRVNRLARELISRGIGAEDRVALAIRRSVDLVVAMYAVSVAGAAYVPVDPDQPAERVGYILETAAPACVLTTAGDGFVLPDVLRHPGGMTGLVWIDELELSGYSAEPVTNAERVRELTAASTAYVIFTSGSTGRPKGVALPHAAIANQLQWKTAEFGLGADDAVLLKTAATFDLSVWEFWSAAVSGGRLVIASADGHRDPAYLNELMARERVTTLHVVPSMLDSLLTEAVGTLNDSLRRVLAIGEALPAAVAQRFRASNPDVELFNLYGPTEAAVSITSHLVSDADAGAVSIGVPEWNSQVYVLDPRLNLVPDGVAGELYLAGAQLARGYFARPDLTADRFVANPFAVGERMYRTGDVVAWNNGELDYRGRTDFQVKIRGFRIELGEIEAALLALPEIAQGAVLAKQDMRTGDRLVAYLVPAGVDLDVAHVKSALAAVLPSYMVPSAFVVLDALPLTVNGKLDRKALPDPEFEATAYRVPSTPIEEIVAAVFAEVLGVERVGAADDFFALGGNSLVATQVVARLGAALDTRVPVRALFEAPTVAALAVKVEGHTGLGRRALTAGLRPERIPLSLAQQRMWFLNQFDPASAAYNIPIAVRLSGALDVDALHFAVADLIERHEILRTIYPQRDGDPAQLILPVGQGVPDLSPMSVEADALLDGIGEFLGAGFDVTAEVPLRARLFRLDDDEYVLAFVVHHISADGWSLGPLTRDVMIAYAARLAGVAPGWSPLPVQYADFSVWQRALLGRADDAASLLATQSDYWRAELADLPDELNLPADRPRPAVQSGAGGRVRFHIDGEMTRAAREFARAHHATLFMVVHAAFAVLLARLSGTGDIAIGTPVAGRGEAELDDAIGMFVNTLVLRTPVHGAESFVELLARTREADLRAFAHAELPFEHLVDVLNPQRSTARHPIFQVMLSFRNLPQGSFALPDLRVEVIDSDFSTEQFDLSLTLSDIGAAGLHAEFSYSRDLFDEATVRGFADRFSAVLDAALVWPHAAVGDLPLLDDAEYRQATRTQPAVVSGELLPDLLDRGVRLGLRRVALQFGGRTVSYGELDDYATRLARVLIARGAGPDTLVAIALPRSLWSVMAIWAVARTGAAFVPIDPTYPPERVRYMLGDAGITLGVTVSAHAAALPELDWLILDDPGVEARCAVASAEPVTDAVRLRPLRPGNLAYVIYTSGSTGLPKGVAVTHAGLSTMVDFDLELYGLNSDHRMLHICSPSFDQSIEEWLLAFASGATVVIAPPDIVGGAELHELLREQRITHLIITPAQLGTVDPAGLDELELVATGGEATTAELIATWQPGRRYLNGYGPTEATIAATYANMIAGQPISIGTPMPGFGAYVLDARLNPVPPGVAGELYLSGRALARGYHGRAVLSAERFVANPFAAGTRMYRTGDLVRWTPGRAAPELAYVGRSDFQVKVRGFRIELGEIDAVLAAHESVEFAVTVGHGAPAGSTILAAYVLPAAGCDIDIPALTEHVAERVPDYMVPTAITVLDAVPLTPVGKLDRRALPEPVLVPREFQSPRTPVEQIVADVLAGVLGLERVGIRDNFFALGGNSLLATQVVARLGAALATRVPVRALFEAPTVAELAVAVEQDAGTGGRPALTARPRPERIPLSLAQQRMWFLNQFDTTSAAYNIPAAVRLTGDLNVVALQQAVADTIERHESLRTVFPQEDGEPHQVIRPAADAVPDLTPIPVAAEALPERIAGVLSAGFDVVHEVPLRAELFQVAGAEAEHVLVFAVHHISADGWSMGPFTRDIMSAYAARINGDVPAWAPLPVQYADYTLWQREVLGSENDPESLISAQAGFWRTTLAGLPDELNLPFDRPRPPVASLRGGTVGFGIDADLYRSLQTLARERNTTLFMVIHTALAILLSRLSGTDDIAIGTPIAGRGEPELDDVIGMFVNTLVLRTRVAGQRSFDELLAEVKDADLAAFAHADLPFERLVELLNPARSTARNPLFQVLLAFQNLPDASLELPGLRVGAADFEASTSQVDLQLAIAEDGDGGALGMFGFARDLFDDRTVEVFAQRFVRLLRAIVDRPGTAVGDLPLLAEDESRQLTRVRGAAVTESALLPELLTRGAELGRDQVAVRDRGHSYTYGELDDYSSQLARVLIQDGVGPETVVAVAFPRSIEMIAAALAVAKAGGAYLPVDPNYPPDRLRHMVTDSGAVLGLTSESLAAGLPGDIDWLCLDEATVDLRCRAASPAAVTDADRPAPIRAATPAYVIYTSGSTGMPKGVTVTHRGLGALRESAVGVCELAPGDRFLHLCSPSFDPSLLEWIWAFSSGATLVVVPPEVLGGAELGEVLRREDVTHAIFTPGVLGTLDPARQPQLRMVLVGGDVTAPELVAKWSSPDRRYYNAYGPTEASIMATSARLEPGGRVTIGTPVHGMSVLVLDDRMHPVPVGVAGELYLGGDGLARGYRNRAALTAERFIADPWGAPGSRLYRTGDVVRRLPDGRIEYVGRSDFQVKIRGFRIELGEIDAVLADRAEVDHAVTLGREIASGETVLVSYVIAAPGHPIDTDRLSRAVAARLPSYMVPTAVVVLDALPLTPVGKLDRAALLEPELRPRTYRAPSTPSENRVAAAFSQVLGRERVGAEDDFFAVGGTSLLATRVVSLLREDPGTRLTVADFFGDATVAGLARRLDTFGTEANTDLTGALGVVLPIRPTGASRPLFCIHPLAGLAWCYAGLSGVLPAGQPILGLQTPALTEPDFAPATLAEIAQRYLAELRAIQPEGPYRLLGWSLGGKLAHHMATMLQQQGDSVELLAILDGYPQDDLDEFRDTLGKTFAELGISEAVFGGDDRLELSDTALDAVQTALASEFSDVPRDLLRRTAAGAVRTVALEHEFRPEVYRGTLLFFGAADPAHAVTGRTAAEWAPFVQGEISDHPVPVTHDRMTDAEALARIGGVLTDTLRRLDDPMDSEWGRGIVASDPGRAGITMRHIMLDVADGTPPDRVHSTVRELMDRHPGVHVRLHFAGHDVVYKIEENPE